MTGWPIALARIQAGQLAGPGAGRGARSRARPLPGPECDPRGGAGARDQREQREQKAPPETLGPQLIARTNNCSSCTTARPSARRWTAMPRAPRTRASSPKRSCSCTRALRRNARAAETAVVAVVARIGEVAGAKPREARPKAVGRRRSLRTDRARNWRMSFGPLVLLAMVAFLRRGVRPTAFWRRSERRSRSRAAIKSQPRLAGGGVRSLT